MYGLIRSQKRWPTEIESLETLSTRYKKSECEDRRDKIFALFSITSEVRDGHLFNVDYTKDIEETFISVVKWAALGPLRNGPIVSFARAIANGLDLEWPDYLLESTIELEDQRSPAFFNWVNQPLRITLWGLNLGKWSFEPRGPLLVAQITPREFRSEPVQVHLPLLSSFHSPTLEFELIALEMSNVFLACQDNHVVARAYCQFHCQDWLLPEHAPTLWGGPGLSRSYVPSVFEGLEVGDFSLALQNVAQFMEILLDKLDPSVWEQPLIGYVGGSGPWRSSFDEISGETGLKAALKIVLKTLKIKSLISLTGVVEEEDSEDSDEDEASETEWDKRRAESEVLAKPKIRKPPIEQPRRRKLQDGSSPSISEEGRFPSPLCEEPTFKDELESLA